MLSFYSDHPSSNPDEVNSFDSFKLLEKNEDKPKESEARMDDHFRCT